MIIVLLLVVQGLGFARGIAEERKALNELGFEQEESAEY